MDDVLIVGAGPAGAVAAIVLARAGVRVRLLDRATFPRRQAVRRHDQSGHAGDAEGALALAAPIDAGGLRVDGMRVTGPTGVAIEAVIRTACTGGRSCAAISIGRCCGRRWRPGRSSNPASPSAARSSRRRAATPARGRRGGRRARAAAGIARAGHHCRGWTAIDAGICPRPRAPSGASEALGDRRLLRERRRVCRRSAKCTCGAAAISASRRFQAAWRTSASCEPTTQKGRYPFRPRIFCDTPR